MGSRGSVANWWVGLSSMSMSWSRSSVGMNWRSVWMSWGRCIMSSRSSMTYRGVRLSSISMGCRWSRVRMNWSNMRMNWGRVGMNSMCVSRSSFDESWSWMNMMYGVVVVIVMTVWVILMVIIIMESLRASYQKSYTEYL